MNTAQRLIAVEKELRQAQLALTQALEATAALQQENQDLKILVAELQSMLFKRKKSKKDDADPDSGSSAEQWLEEEPSGQQRTRPTHSYQRSVPPDSEVTAHERHTLDRCAACDGALEELDACTIYIEDIPQYTKTVTKKTIHRYACCDCGKQQTKIPIPPGQRVRLGPGVKQYVLYHTYVLNTSYRDITRSLNDCHRIKISAGEIQHIQQESAKKLLSAYNGIHQELKKQESVNIDETSWSVKGALNYLWGLCSPTTSAALFHAGSRGKGNVASLLDGFSGCATSDCYGAYRNLPEGMDHQICWVHILRNAKELAGMPYLSDEQRQSAIGFYRALLGIYGHIKQALNKPYHPQERSAARGRLLKELQGANQLLPCDTPKKLKNLKLLTQQYQHELFTCLSYKTALPENNLAERNLRHVVLKRKRSFGSQTEKGARIFAVNASVILTFWKRFPNTFFLELGKALGY